MPVRAVLRHNSGMTIDRDGAAPRVAYLTNVYPKISHSFIRTEIAALERRGYSVSRFTVRRAQERFDDPEDRAEAERTAALLEDRAGLAGAVLACLATQPHRVPGAWRLAWRSSGRRMITACAYFAEAALLARRLRQDGIRHVHVHFGTNPATVARLASRLAPVTYSFTVHGPDEFDDPRGLDLSGKIAEAAFVIGISRFGRGQLMRWAALSDWGRIQVVPCAASPRFLAPEGPLADIPERPHFLCIARLSAQKGLPLLIEAAAMVAARRPITLDIIGDGEDRAAIERQIAQAGLGGVISLRGWATPEAIRAALKDARALVVPSFAEGLPVVIMEAMACRRPVIATTIAGIPELVDRSAGWLVPSGCVEALAAALDAALDASGQELAAKGEQGHLRVLERHDPERSATRLSALLAPFL